MAEADVISLKLHEVLTLDKRSLARGHWFVVIFLTLSGPGFSEHPQAEGGLN